MWWQRFVGLPFEDRGRGPEAFDCWGLCRAVLADRLGVELPAYGEISAADLMRRAQAMTAEAARERWVPVDRPRALDVAVMGSARAVTHVGVMIDARRVLHTEAACGSVVVPLSHPQMRGRVRGFRRLTA